MIIRSLIVMLTFGGFVLWFFSKVVPFFALLGLDYVGCFMMIVPCIIVLVQLSRTNTSVQFDPPSGGRAIINYLRRDGTVVPLLATRVYAGESFLDVPKLGLIEDLGKDTVFNWGVRRTRLGLENINYTPDPRYFNLTRELYRIGFDSDEDLWNVLNVSLIKDQGLKAYYLEYMGMVYANMMNPPARGVKRLVKELKEKKPGKKHMFGKKRAEMIK